MKNRELTLEDVARLLGNDVEVLTNCLLTIRMLHRVLDDDVNVGREGFEAVAEPEKIGLRDLLYGRAEVIYKIACELDECLVHFESKVRNIKSKIPDSV